MAQSIRHLQSKCVGCSSDHQNPHKKVGWACRPAGNLSNQKAETDDLSASWLTRLAKSESSLG